MTNRERFNAIMHYQPVDRLPVCHFGYWLELIDRWEAEGHLPAGTAAAYRKPIPFPDGGETEQMIDKLLGFDFNIFHVLAPTKAGWMPLNPPFEEKVIKEVENGAYVLDAMEGTVQLRKHHKDGKNVTCIAQTVDYTLKDRASWEKEFMPRLESRPDVYDYDAFKKAEEEEPTRDYPLALYCGSTLGQIRSYLGFENFCTMQIEDPDFLCEMAEYYSRLYYEGIKKALEYNIKFDFAHFWEDLAFNSGPSILPSLFEEACGPNYKRITDLLTEHGIDIISVDNDGRPFDLSPTWFGNGLNTMFPIEVGLWDGNLRPYREKYGKTARGLGGMKKSVFAQDYAAVDAEIERLKPLVEMGGYIPHPDHRITADAKWENVQYYCDKMHSTFQYR